MIIELLCVVGLLYGLISGWINGLLKELCSTLGFALGLFLAYYCYEHYSLGLGWSLLLALVFPLGLGLLASLVSKLLNGTPVLGTMNRLLGAVVGCLKIVVLIFFIMWIAGKFEEWKSLLTSL